MAYGAIREVDVSVGDGTTPWSDAPIWRVRTPWGTFAERDLARTSGLRIMVVVGSLCVVLGLSVVWKGDVNETAAGFFPPAGAAFVAMIVVPYRRWGWVVGGILFPSVIGLALGVAPTASVLLWGLANCVEPALAALLIRRFQASGRATPAGGVAAFMVCAVLIGPMVGATIGTYGTTLGYETAWLGPWAEWAIGDGLGVLVVTPLLLSYTRRAAVPRTRAEKAGYVVLVGTAAGLAFADIGSNGAALLPYLILVALIWAGMRLGTLAVAAAGFVVAFAANIATSLQVGPFAAGNGSVDVVTLQIFLVIALVASFVVAAMASETAGRDEVHRLLTYQATHDPLTGLPNRSLFNQRLHEALSVRDAAPQSLAIVLVDLDDFKKINDRHGHPAGDGALQTIAQRLRDGVRPHDVLARLGGDEFVVLASGLRDHDDVIDVAQRLSQSLDPPVEVDGVEYRMVGSLGVSYIAADADITASELLRRADIALYHSKRSGAADGSGISLFDDALEASTLRRADLDVELRGAIERGEMSVAYQPIVNLMSGEITEFEALARWESRRFGSVRPDEFIAVAEQTGLISQIGDWVLEQACRQTASWRASSPTGDVTVAVNASARQLCDAAFPGRVAQILTAANLPAGALTIEITETAVMDDLEASVLVLEALRNLGVRLSMDDFGTGYSSMTNLRRFPLQTLKIDRSFVAGLGNVREDTAIVESIITLGHSCGLQVVAEGIETEVHLRQLNELGCDYGQGFLWSRPVSADEIGSRLAGAAARADRPAASVAQPAAHPVR